MLGIAASTSGPVTDSQKTPPYLLGLYDPDDLTNGARLPIVLAMTCLTSAFQTPNYSRTTLDERWLIKPNGGAVAIWGPTGFGVAHGHDAMQRGFYRALWAAPPQSATLGPADSGGLPGAVHHRQLLPGYTGNLRAAGRPADQGARAAGAAGVPASRAAVVSACAAAARYFQGMLPNAFWISIGSLRCRTDHSFRERLTSTLVTQNGKLFASCLMLH